MLYYQIKEKKTSLELKKYKNLYVYFDKNSNPIYSFEVDNDIIKKFHLMAERMPDKIILPKIQINETDYDKISNTRMLKAIALLNECKNEKFIISKCKNALEKYANGAMEVATGCFAGIKKLTLVVPADYSIMLGWNCFDNNAEINLELPKDMTLKQIFRIFDTSFDYERENWTLISHKNFNYKNKNYCGIHTTEFKPEYASRYKFTISGKKLEFDENKNL